MQQSRLLHLLKKRAWPDKRSHIYYEAPTPQLGSRPLATVRTNRYKYIEKYQGEEMQEAVFQELYNLEDDPYELKNLAQGEAYQDLVTEFSRIIEHDKNQYR